MNKPRIGGMASILVVLASGCASTPEPVAELDRAHSAVIRLDRDPRAEAVAGGELQAAKQALEKAERMHEEGAEREVIRHHAYLANRHAQIIESRIDEATTRERIENAETERTKVLLHARTREAERAKALARATNLQAQQYAREAERQRHRADQALRQATELEESIAELIADQTEQGAVLTLSNVLFDSNQDTLKPGAAQALDRLAGFLEMHPERQLIIEGHTDSRGEPSYNRALSLRRANAVRGALISHGVAADRLRAVGLGEDFPVATNETLAGRQQNRRVEIRVSNNRGDFAEVVQKATW